MFVVAAGDGKLMVWGGDALSAVVCRQYVPGLMLSIWNGAHCLAWPSLAPRGCSVVVNYVTLLL
jgi:hypothetical protein